MRIPALTLCAALAAGSFLSLSAPEARANATGGPVVAAQTEAAPRTARNVRTQRATREEERNYAKREAQAPSEVKKYTGGWVIAVLVIVALVFIIIYFAQRT